MTELIKENYSWGDTGLIDLDQNDEGGIRELLIGHKVTKVADDRLLLDNGAVVKVVPNEGGCSCGAGDYELKTLNDCDNIITRVDFENVALGDGDWEPDQAYRIYVVAEDKRINLVDIEGNDGNGYYGTGYELLVRYPT